MKIQLLDRLIWTVSLTVSLLASITVGVLKADDTEIHFNQVGTAANVKSSVLFTLDTSDSMQDPFDNYVAGSWSNSILLQQQMPSLFNQLGDDFNVSLMHLESYQEEQYVYWYDNLLEDL